MAKKGGGLETILIAVVAEGIKAGIDVVAKKLKNKKK